MCMDVNLKKILPMIFLCLMTGCALMPTISSEFIPPKGLFVTAVKAPLSVKAKNKKMGKKPNRQKYFYTFFWIPFLLPPVSFTTASSKNGFEEKYVDYEYFSFFFGMFQKTTIISYQ